MTIEKEACKAALNNMKVLHASFNVVYESGRRKSEWIYLFSCNCPSNQ